MARTGRGRARRLVLDIGSNTIRLCELVSTKTGYQLTKYLQREVLKDPSVSEEDRHVQRVDALRAILAESKIRARRTVFGVPGRSVFTRSRALPPVPEYKVTQIVRYEIQQQIPFSLDQIALDYQVVDRTEAGGYEVMMAAIKVDVVEKELEILRHIKRAVDIVDVCPLACYNWMKHAGAFGNQGECVALLDMGATTTDIVIEREGLFRFTRPLNLGGNDITAAISREFGLSFADSEKLKRQRGFAPTGDPARDGKGGEVIGRVLSRLVTEVSRSFAYFRSLPGGGTVSRVVLTGGAACLRNMVPYLRRELELDVSMAQPLTGLTIGAGAQAAREHPQQVPVVLGLALRCCETVPIAVNLIPPWVLDSARRKEQAFYWVLVMATLGLIMASIIPVKASENKNVRERIRYLEQYVQAYDPELVRNPAAGSHFEGELQAATDAVKQRQKQVKSLDNAVKNSHFWLAELTKINEARPPGNKIWFSSVETTNISSGGRQGPQTQGRRGGGGRGGRGMGGMGGMGMAGLGGLGGGRGQPQGGAAEGIFSSGFPGLAAMSGAQGPAGRESRRGGLGRGGGGGGGFGLGGGLGGTARGFSGNALMDPKAESAAPPQPNGLKILGYARDTEALAEFITQLEQDEFFTKEGVHFNEGSVRMVSIYELDNARVAQRAVTPAAGTGMMGRDADEGRFGFGRRGRGGALSGASGYGQGARTEYPIYGETVIEFSVDLQFASTIKEPEPEPEEKPAALTANPLDAFRQRRRGRGSE